MRQSLLIALIATGQLAFIYWQTESSASNMPFLLGHDGPCVIYMLQVAESVLPKTLRDGAYKVIAKAEDLLRKRDGWVDWQNSIARRETILMHTDGTMKSHSSMQDNFLDVFRMINCTASLFRMSCPFLHAVYCVLSRYVNIVKVLTQTLQTDTEYLVGGLEHFLFFHILGMSWSQLTFIFFRGVQTTNQIWFGPPCSWRRIATTSWAGGTSSAWVRTP